MSDKQLKQAIIDLLQRYEFPEIKLEFIYKMLLLTIKKK